MGSQVLGGSGGEVWGSLGALRSWGALGGLWGLKGLLGVTGQSRGALRVVSGALVGLRVS